MSETSPTPLPWFVHDFSEVPGFVNPSPADVTISCDHPATITVASMDRALTATLEEARANAAFIVHAVNCHAEMVEALSLVRMSAGWQAMSAETRAIVEAALSKATQTETGE